MPRRTAHFNERGRAADECGFAAGNVIVLRERAHERQIDVDMRINEAGEDKFAFRINHRRAFRRRDATINTRDGFVVAEDVRHVAFAGRDYFAVLDKQSHARC